MRRAFGISAGIHLVAMALVWFPLPDWFKREVEEAPPIDVDVIVLGPMTNVPETRKEIVSELEAPPDPEPMEQAKLDDIPPPPPPPEPEPKPEPVKLAEMLKAATPEKAEVDELADVPPLPPKPKKKPDPEPEKKVAEQKPPEKPKSDQKTEAKFDLNRIANLVNTQAKPTPPPKAPPTAKVAERNQKGIGDPNAQLSLNERDALRTVIQKNWAVDLGALDADKLIVVIRFTLDRSGNLSGPVEIAEVNRNDAWGRAAAEKARRAVLITFAPDNTKDRPLLAQILRPDNYGAWGEVEVTFNPKGMFGG